MLELRNITKHFGPPQAAPLLIGISMAVPPGETTALLGASGSGKSTLMRFAASVWGNDNFLYPCNGTLNGFELRAKLLSGLPFFLDDVQLMRSRPDFNEFMQSFIYMLFNGYGKQRATKELGSAMLNRWQTLNILSSLKKKTVGLKNWLQTCRWTTAF